MPTAFAVVFCSLGIQRKSRRQTKAVGIQHICRRFSVAVGNTQPSAKKNFTRPSNAVWRYADGRSHRHIVATWHVLVGPDPTYADGQTEEKPSAYLMTKTKKKKANKRLIANTWFSIANDTVLTLNNGSPLYNVIYLVWWTEHTSRWRERRHPHLQHKDEVDEPAAVNLPSSHRQSRMLASDT